MVIGFSSDSAETGEIPVRSRHCVQPVAAPRDAVGSQTLPSEVTTTGTRDPHAEVAWRYAG